MRRSDFLTGLIIGGLIGAAAALLYTPASGSNLRAQARNYAERVRREVKEAAMARRAQLEEELASLRLPHKTPES